MPGLRLRVGVTGHRPNKLPPDAIAALEATIARVLAHLASAVEEHESTVSSRAGRTQAVSPLTLVSSLAEGTDRLAANLALAQGWSLQCPLPFRPKEYEKDFAGEPSRQEFRTLLARAESVFILDEARAMAGMAEARPYEAAGLVMQQASDLLIAVWDGDKAAGQGGTALVVERALAVRMPVITVDPARPDEARLLWPGLTRLAPAAPRPEEVLQASQDAFPVLSKVVASLVAAPDSQRQSSRLASFLGETDILWALWSWYPLLLGVLGVRRPRLGDVRVEGSVDASVGQLRRQWPFGDRQTPLSAAVDATLLPALVFADRLAVAYAGLYRSAFVFNYLAAAAAVGLALAGLVFEAKKGWLVLVELLLIICIFANTYRGWSRGWHRRWMDYRRLAETLRHMRFGALVGSGGRFGPASALPRDGELDWVDWYALRIRRMLPLPDASVDGAYLAALVRHLQDDEIAPQVAYHQSNWRKMTAVGTRLHWAGLICFIASALICVVFLSLKLRDTLFEPDWIDDGIKHLVTIATAFFPTLGASLNAIRFQGDFEKTAERSLETLRRLKVIDAALEREKAGNTLSLALVSDRIDKIGTAIMADLDEWHLFTETRPLSLPA